MHNVSNNHYSGSYVKKTAQITHPYSKLAKKQMQKNEFYDVKPNYFYKKRVDIETLVKENKQLKRENAFYQEKFLAFERKIDKLTDTMQFVANKINKMKKNGYAFDGFDVIKTPENKENKEKKEPENNLWEKIRKSKNNENDSELTADILTNSIKLLYNKAPESATDSLEKSNVIGNVVG